MPGASGIDDPLHELSAPATAWTIVNTQEAMPGVLTPLGWTFWRDPVERAARKGFADLGVLSAREAGYLPPGPGEPGSDPLRQRASAVFFGRYSFNVSFMRALADRMPGTSGDAVEHQLMGALATGAGSPQTRRRYPVIGFRLPTHAARLPKLLRRIRAGHHAWWQSAVSRPAGTAEAAGRHLEAAMARFEEAMRAHCAATMLSQAFYEQIRKLAADSGDPGLELRLITGYGTVEETQITADLWDVSRQRLSMEAFLLRHGFHGPDEGELSSRSWREDQSPLNALLERYQALGDDHDPRRTQEQRAVQRRAAEAELLGRLSPLARRRAGMLLAAARRYIPLREVGKGAFLLAIDGGRAAARQAGRHLADAGDIDDPDDVFYLTPGELVGGVPDARERVSLRKARREEYRGYRLPERWVGQPDPVVAGISVDHRDLIEGLPVSPGIVEGTARVLRDATEADTVEEGDILVCETTDPSWAVVFPLVSALVIDVGGPMSHGAIVAREMGVPCVINTKDGTKVVGTGDSLRVDGSQGTVEIVARREATDPGLLKTGQEE